VDSREEKKMAKRLTSEQIASFTKDGYIAPCRAVSEREAAEYFRRVEGFEERTGLHAEGSLKIKAQLASPWMVDLACNPGLPDVVEDLIGPNILLFRSSLFAKNAHDPGFVSWHQDSLYYGQVPSACVTAWVAVHRESSGQWLLARDPRFASRRQSRARRTQGTEQSTRARGHTVIDVNEADAVDLTLRPGEFSVHDECTVHGSMPNESDRRRISLAFFFGLAHVSSVRGRRNAVLVRGVDEYRHRGEERFCRERAIGTDKN
jgi:non-heme Fe2+,alpha-ketoglutarate-dependent halogenase